MSFVITFGFASTNEIRAIAHIGVRIGARHVKHAGTTERRETVGCSPGSRQLSPCGRSTEMISNGRSNANRNVLVKCVGQNLLPTA